MNVVPSAIGPTPFGEEKKPRLAVRLVPVMLDSLIVIGVLHVTRFGIVLITGAPGLFKAVETVVETQPVDVFVKVTL